MTPNDFVVCAYDNKYADILFYTVSTKNNTNGEKVSVASTQDNMLMFVVNVDENRDFTLENILKVDNEDIELFIINTSEFDLMKKISIYSGSGSEK